MTLEQTIQAMRDKIRLRHLAWSTEESYVGWVRRYCLHGRKLPKEMPAEKKAESFLTDLAKRLQVAARTQNQALAAILFLYRYVLDRPLGNVNALRARKYYNERVAPSREQVRQLREEVLLSGGPLYRLIIDLLYGCGLRVSEPLELRLKDIDWEQGQLVIRAAKGNKDRRVPLPRSCLEPLRAQVKRAEAVWKEDQGRRPRVGVPMPHALGRKYPGASVSWAWFWVFPASGLCKDPRSGETVRYHLLHDQVQRAVRVAAIRLGLEGILMPHALRHAYATHSKESIETLRTLMGHVSIETTAGYRHPEVERATNPLDELLATTAPTPPPGAPPGPGHRSDLPA